MKIPYKVQELYISVVNNLPEFVPMGLSYSVNLIYNKKNERFRIAVEHEMSIFRSFYFEFDFTHELAKVFGYKGFASHHMVNPKDWFVINKNTKILNDKVKYFLFIIYDKDRPLNYPHKYNNGAITGYTSVGIGKKE